MSSLTFWFNYYVIEVYTINCRQNGGRNCTITPEIPRRTDVQLTDEFPVTDGSDTGVYELTLSSDLAMFFAYLLRFCIFHGLGLLLCWISTMSFRRTSRR